MLAFVEGALAQTNPGRAFTLGVLAALPVFTLSAKAATLGVTAAKGGATAKAAATSGLLSAFLTPALGFFGNYIGYRISMDGAQSDVERERIRRFYRKLMVCILGFFVGYGLLLIGAKQIIADHDLVYTSLIMGLTFPFIFVYLASAIWSLQNRRQFAAEARAQRMTAVPATVFWEYRSRFVLLGLPLIHIRINGGLTGPLAPVKAWMAAADCAVGLLFAFGRVAIAPVSVGGLAVGVLPFGACAVGVLALGGFSLGIWSFGGLAAGWQVFGACAIAWNSALGGVAIAHDCALGGMALASQANNAAARASIQPNLFFHYAPIALRYLVWLNLIWIINMLAWWRVVARNRRRQDSAAQGS